MVPDLLTVDETAAILRIARGRCYELLRRGFIPVVHLGRQVRVSRAELEQFIARGGQRLESEAEPHARHVEPAAARVQQ